MRDLEFGLRRLVWWRVQGGLEGRCARIGADGRLSRWSKLGEIGPVLEQRQRKWKEKTKITLQKRKSRDLEKSEEI